MKAAKQNLKNREKAYHKVNFTYDWKTDSFIYPINEHLHYKNDRKLNGEWMRVYSTNKCKTCPVKNQCTKSRVREIFEPVDDLRWKMKADFISRRKNLLQKKSKSKRSTLWTTTKHT